MHFKRQITPYILRYLWLLLLVLFVKTATAVTVEFRQLDTNNGLASSQINCIFKDRSGYLWMGTPTGLSRFDGFRFKNFCFNGNDKTSVRSNTIEDIVQDADGQLWVGTNEGYCIYDPTTEKFNRKPETWMAEKGMSGVPGRVFADGQHNLWIAVNGKGCYVYYAKTRTPHLFTMGKGRNQLPFGVVTDITQRGASIVVTYDNGTMIRLDPERKRVVWVNTTLAQNRSLGKNQTYETYIDTRYNYWVLSNNVSMVYSSAEKRWFDNAADYLRHVGINCQVERLNVKAVAEDRQQQLWIATEHEGLFVVNRRQHTIEHYTYTYGSPNTLPDNTLQTLYQDNDNGMWIGTYKNGVAYYSPQLSRYKLVSLGDICTITQDLQGNYWCGTNDAGLVCYNPYTGKSVRLGKDITHLGTDVVVSSLRASDGSLWFGTFNGGMVHYANGIFTAYKKEPGRLANNSVWSLTEDKRGNIWIGTLGSGLQVLKPKTGQFITVNNQNSKLTSNYIATLCTDRNGNIIAGHSQGVSVINAVSLQITNIAASTNGQSFDSRAVNDVFVDRRGLIWCATMGGVNIYDPVSKKIYRLASPSQMACSVAEDRMGNVWVTFDHGAQEVKVTRKGNLEWDFFATNFDELDGLQKRRFNLRSIMLDANGNIIMGGQDGINIIPPTPQTVQTTNAKVLFSGLVLFDHLVNVGEEFNGSVITEQDINSSRMLRLRHSDNTFTLLLASDRISVPQKVRFQYRMEGVNDGKWMLTYASQPSITFTNLSSGTYKLQVKVVNRDGTVSREISQLTIVIDPPFWLSAWAFAIYFILIVLVVWLIWRFTIYQQLEKMKIEQIQKEAERNRKLDEMKLTFLTSVSHELRTPLALVISPLKAMLEKEQDKGKLQQLNLILRNANRLLNLVNQTLDLRMIEKKKAELNLHNGDIVGFVRDICNAHTRLSQKQIKFTFTSTVPCLNMSFDDDKVYKIANNLLSNAFKFTPSGGQIAVSLGTTPPLSTSATNLPVTVTLRVADTGAGISDADKTYVFDRFYQAHNQTRTPFGGNGIGLNLVKEFTALHGGTVSVADNPGGGTVFTVSLPYRLDETLPDLNADSDPLTVNSVQNESASEEQQVLMDDANDRLRRGEYEVLLVDDSDDFLQFVTSQLQEIYKVRTAHNGIEALKLVGEHKPDIILSDVMMPEMDGNELCRAIKGNPKTERIPFVMLTARLSTNCKIEGLTNGADDYITKPFNFDLLNLRIGNLLKWHNATPVGEKMDPKIKQQEITSLDEQLVEDATRYVEAHLSDSELSVETMSEELSMSRVHLYKRLLSATGNTPSEFIRLVRLRHAEQLLRNSQLNVSEVAYRVGFNNPRYFSKYFKELYGVMPSQYRKQGTAE